MILPQSQDAIHKAWLYRTLAAIADDLLLMQYLRFKGGTCAAMLNRLDRFSVDLDFDLCSESSKQEQIVKDVGGRLENIFSELGLEIKDASKRGVQYFLRYEAAENMRNTIKIDATFPVPVSNVYEPTYFSDIDRTIWCQTIETMFANKLVAVLDRWDTHGSLAGRDIYDIHYFFLKGYRYLPAVIEERRTCSVKDFFEQLIEFVEKRVTQMVIQQDLNTLLPAETFRKIQKTLKSETVMLLRDELERVQQVR